MALKGENAWDGDKASCCEVDSACIASVVAAGATEMPCMSIEVGHAWALQAIMKEMIVRL